MEGRGRVGFTTGLKVRKMHRETSLKHRFTLERKPSGGKAQNEAGGGKKVMEKKDRWVAINRTLGIPSVIDASF